MSDPHHDQSPDWVEFTEEEEKVWTGRPSLLIFAKKLLTGLLIGVASIALFLSTPGRFSWRPLILLVGLPGWLIIVGVVVWHQSIKYVVTSDEIYIKWGIFPWKQIRNFRLDRIQHTEVSRSIIQGILSYGNVELATAGTDTIEHVLKWIPDPERVNRTIAAQLDSVSSRGPSSPYRQSPDLS
jgi:uncharacterized membrane protein YdbT with pleckstrin-like domain